ncbi:conserved hypothetical protein [Sphingomonas sp. T1]|uniref:hypothetical protein n=1 Tax=Sphingomonas sp. T1 TaxID=2653172 RepID=UPI0012EEEC91|nr:hypothetical protein [Sphingomonas sp. T1]VXD05304.1 conserved hypothetical protein [Sphingomonas sp. T1]
MAEIDPYVRTLFIQSYGKLGIAETPLRRSELVSVIVERVKSLLSDVGFADVTEAPPLAELIADELIAAKVIYREAVQFAGEYLTFRAQAYQEYRNKVLVQDPIYNAGQRIGARFFPDVFTGYISSVLEGQDEIPLMGLAPASGRIVTFSDNQMSELDKQTSEVIDAVAAQNQIGGVAGLRELILGQLKAGRELIRAGSFRVYFLQLTLIQSLQYLVARYEKEVVGGLAAALIAALMKQIGIDA